MKNSQLRFECLMPSICRNVQVLVREEIIDSNRIEITAHEIAHALKTELQKMRTYVSFECD